MDRVFPEESFSKVHRKWLKPGNISWSPNLRASGVFSSGDRRDEGICSGGDRDWRFALYDHDQHGAINGLWQEGNCWSCEIDNHDLWCISVIGLLHSSINRPWLSKNSAANKGTLHTLQWDKRSARASLFMMFMCKAPAVVFKYHHAVYHAILYTIELSYLVDLLCVVNLFK